MSRFIRILTAALVVAVSLAAGLASAADPAQAAHRQELQAYALTHSGDKDQGAKLWNGLRCKACHSLTSHAEVYPPSLAGVGERRDLEQIITQILFPRQSTLSHRVRVTFADGRVTEFALVAQDDVKLTVRDLETGAEITLLRTDVENIELVVRMPSGLVDHLTEEQFADLVAFLLSLT
jgi:putative heme-binding domain-containing protein